MSSSWIAVYVLLVLTLTGVAIYEHINTTKLSLPVSPTLTILTILLPVLAAANAFYLPHLIHRAKSTGSTFQKLLPIALQVLQLIFTTALATLFSSDALLPSPLRGCALETRWKEYWTEHNAESIRSIQDALNCCGFRTVKHMAWPFPHGSGGSGGGTMECATRFGRTVACQVPWEQAMQRNEGVEFGVVVLVVVMQVVSFAMMRVFGSVNFQGSVWGRWLARVFGQVDDEDDGDLGGAGRPLLREQPGEVDDVEEGVDERREDGCGAIRGSRQQNPWEGR